MVAPPGFEPRSADISGGDPGNLGSPLPESTMIGHYTTGLYALRIQGSIYMVFDAIIFINTRFSHQNMGGTEYVELNGRTYEIRFERSSAHIIFDDASPEIKRVTGYRRNDLTLEPIESDSREYMRVLKNLRRGILGNPGKRKTRAQVVHTFDPDADITDMIPPVDSFVRSDGVERYVLLSLARR